MKHIDKVFKDGLYNHETPVPEGMWDKIAPAVEEESGRSIFWMWFTGIMILGIAGLIAFFMMNRQEASAENTAPISEVITTTSQPSKSVKVASGSVINANTPLEQSTAVADRRTTGGHAQKGINPSATPTTSSRKNARKGSTAKSEIPTPVYPTVSKIEGGDIEIATEEVAIDAPEIMGTPVNLVITKSYISEHGSIVEQSNVSKKKDEQVYNVFINSEGLNAGALMRIVEPLQRIPLPAFVPPLKKKILTTL